MSSDIKFFVDIFLLSGSFTLIVLFRHKIAEWFLRIPASRFIVYIISSLPFMLIEENINCLPIGCRLIPPTIPFLILFVAILGLFVRRRRNEKVLFPLVVFSIFGILFESSIGASSGELRSLVLTGSPLGYFMLFWVGLSYAYIALIPLEVLLNKSVPPPKHLSLQ